MIFPIAPAKMSDKFMISPRWYLCLIIYTNPYPIPNTATIRNKVNTSLPVSPPNSMPNAIPLFSVK